MEFSLISECFPDVQGHVTPPPPLPNGGRYTGAVIPAGAAWGPVAVRPDAAGLMARVRADGGGGGGGEGTYHFTGGSVRPGNHTPPLRDLTPCCGGKALCVAGPSLRG